MIGIAAWVDLALRPQIDSGKPLGVVLAGHNGSGKSTMWRAQLSSKLQIPLVNADRMMISVLPEPDRFGFLPTWAATLRDTDESWMRVAQKGVEAFVAQAMVNKVPFAMETVFSQWIVRPDGSVSSKIDLIGQMQAAGYFVLLAFVGLSSSALSIARVQTRIGSGGHAVAEDKLLSRFGRTQTAIRSASQLADACIMVDNSRSRKSAFTVCQIRLGAQALFDIRQRGSKAPAPIRAWLDIVSPLPAT